MGIDDVKPTVWKRTSRSKGRELRRSIACEVAADALGEIAHDCEIFGLTMGQFSLVDIIDHCLKATGPADVVISTWTAAGADMDFALSLLANGAIKSLRFVVDFSFPRRKPQYCAALRERFGDSAIRVTKSHAKFVTIENADWALVIRSSMNLNENRRLESFEISDDRAMAGYLAEVVEALFAEHGDGVQFDNIPGQNAREFETLARLGDQGSFFGDGPVDVDLRRAGVCTSKGKKL